MILVLRGEVSGAILFAGILSVAISAAAAIAGYLFLRRERAARWLGAKAARPLSWILMKFKRDPVEDGAARATELRTRARSGAWAGVRQFLGAELLALR